MVALARGEGNGLLPDEWLEPDNLVQTAREDSFAKLTLQDYLSPQLQVSRRLPAPPLPRPSLPFWLPLLSTVPSIGR